jgi:hypothetical protein
MSQTVDVTDLIDEIETAWIPLADGRQLAVRLFLPRDARSQPAPVILEYIPYRRRDGTRQGDEAMHRWFAARGFACARVDIAGTGDSDGLVDDEYVRREQDDGLEVIEWLAAQPWSSGSVGMIGISWGGFNGLQIAARRPPALKTVISLCSVTDRYHGDVHYTGGCLNEENMEWGAYFFTMNGFPPDPAIVGDRWRDMWRTRIDNAKLAPADWLEHQQRDGFWRHGSVCEDWSAIEVPVLVVSGWADGYTAAVFELVEHLHAPCKGIVGPWGHKYPQQGVPGPAIGFLQEAARWFGRWLRNDPTGVEHDPAMRMWLQESAPPQGHIAERAGQWIEFATWPPTDDAVTSRVLQLCAERLTDIEPADEHAAAVRSPQTIGLAGGQWCAYGLGKIAPELPLDQRGDDAGSLTFDSPPLTAALHVVGRPRLRLRIAADQPRALVAVRLNSVHPDGTSERLSYGVLNLCHRNGHDAGEDIVPGEPVDVEIELKGIAQTVPVGHRVRVSISTSYWPMIWPSPRAVTLSVHSPGSCVELPVCAALTFSAADLFGDPEEARAGGVTVLRDGSERRHILYDVGERRTEVVAARDDGVSIIDDIGTEQSFTRVRRSSIVDGEPLSATARVECRATNRREDWDVRVESDIELTSDETSFLITARLEAFEAGTSFAVRHFSRTIPRGHL